MATLISIASLLLWSSLRVTEAAPEGISKAKPGAAGLPSPNMPPIAAIDERGGKYFNVPESAKGPPID